MANNIATPMVTSPTLGMQNYSNGIFAPVAITAEIPKVNCVADAKTYPGKAGTEDVLLDQNDPEIAYFRRIDVNGFVQVDRRRCIAEPEPTAEEIADKKYLTKDEFASFMDEFKAFRKEMSDNVRVFAASNTATPTNVPANSKSNSSKQSNGQHQSSKVTVANAQNGNKSQYGFSANDGIQSEPKTNC